MQGQAAHFSRYAPTKIQYGIDRYVNETRRLYRVLETQLSKSKSGFLVGDHISIADIAALSWVMYGRYGNINMDDFPALQKWDDMLSARPGISRGFHVPKELKMKKEGYDPVAAEEYAKKASQWILKGMEEDKTK
jgi:glutathione S-transferase